MVYLRCPVCGKILTENEHGFSCVSGHSFDKASSGYVNLLMSNASGKRHGDDKLMVRSRRDFLDKGFYEQLKNELVKVTDEYCEENSVICDVGCGEGYYTSAFCKNKEYGVFGIDISKDALKYASKRCRNFKFAVASAFSLPFENESIDALVNVFAPCAYGEFSRVLKNDGVLIKAVPLENHLWELKKAIYEKPYKNKPEIVDETLFKRVFSKELQYEIVLENKKDISALFSMTPYFYKTSREDTEKLLNLEHLEITVNFGIEVYKKINGEMNNV